MIGFAAAGSRESELFLRMCVHRSVTLQGAYRGCIALDRHRENFDRTPTCVSSGSKVRCKYLCITEKQTHEVQNTRGEVEVDNRIKTTEEKGKQKRQKTGESY